MRFRLVTKVGAVAVAGVLVLAGGIAYAASSVSVPNAGGQLEGTVFVCVNTTNEAYQYVELGHPAPGNCHAGFLQYTANQPAPAATVTVTPSSSPSPVVSVNSENFTYGTAGTTPCAYDGKTTFCVSLPSGTHLTGAPTVTDLDSSAARPVAATAVTDDDVTGLVTVTWGTNAPLAGHSIQVTYDYSR